MMYLVIFFIGINIWPSAFACDPNCECSWNTVSCTQTQGTLDRIPDDIPYSTNYLTVDNHFLKNLSSLDCSRRPNLQHLFIRNNLIDTLKADDFNGCSAMQELNLDNNLISSLRNDTFVWLSALNSLSIRNNSINQIAPGTFLTLYNLQSLYLEDNSLSNASFVASLTTNLKEIYLDFNVISEIDEAFPDGIQVISIKNNSLTEILNGTFSNCHQIYTLQLDGNQITRIEVGSFPDNVLNLRLEYNMIRSLPKGVFPSHAGIISVSNNLLTEITNGTFSNCHEVFYLYLESNMISQIEVGAFPEPSFITNLHLSHNLINTLQEGMLPAVPNLWLNDNKLTEIRKGMFKNYYYTPEIHLESNMITFIENDAFKGFGSYYLPYLSDNPVWCNFLTIPLNEWLTEGHDINSYRGSFIGINTNQINVLYIEDCPLLYANESSTPELSV